MIEIRSGLKSVTDREKWAARGASFVAKAKATKAVWFPPEPVETGKKPAKKTAAGYQEVERCRQEGGWGRQEDQPSTAEEDVKRLGALARRDDDPEQSLRTVEE